jgi:FkbM family methyltransferase
MLMRTVFGHKLYLDTRDQSVAHSLILDGYWEKHVTRAYLKLVKPGATVVEVGANVGYFTTLAAGRVGPSGRVYAFEANPDVAAMLRRSIGLNGQAGWCSVIEQAVCDQVGTVTFYCLRREQGNSSLRGVGAGVDMENDVHIIQAPATTLDAYFGESPPRIDVMKIDAEGAEPLIFSGMRRLLEANPDITIVMEFAREMIQQVSGSASAFVQEVRSLGFSFQLVTESGSLRRIDVDDLLSRVYCEVVLRRS